MAYYGKRSFNVAKMEAYRFSTQMRVEVYQEINSITLKQSSLHSVLFECMKVPLIKPQIYGKADLKPAVPYLVNIDQICFCNYSTHEWKALNLLKSLSCCKGLYLSLQYSKRWIDE